MKGECLVCGEKDTSLDSRSVCMDCNGEFSNEEIKRLLEEREMKES